MDCAFNEKVKDLILAGLAKFDAEGVAAAVVKDGELVVCDGFGLADKTAGEAMTNEHVFPIASTSKAFTAACAAMLAGEGKLDLDKPVRSYMPEFELYDPLASASATARDLLCHRTGMPRHDLMWILWDSIERDELIFKRLKSLPPNKPFRSVWQYQNHMYAAAGCLVERLSGQTWEDFVKTRIFAPLGMESSGFHSPDPALKHSKLYKKGKDGESEECQAENAKCVGPAGSIRSNVSDMAKWLSFNLGKGKAGEAELIKEALFSELSKPNIPYQLFPFEVDETIRIGYGLGWFIDCFRGETIVSHGGNLSGSSTLVSMLPGKSSGCVILANSDGSLLPYAIALSIYDMMLGKEGEKDWLSFFHERQKELRSQSDKALEGILSAKAEGKPMLHELDEYAGAYSHPGYGDLDVKAEDGGLVVDIHGNKLALRHLHYDIFHTEVVGFPIHASFKTGLKGDVSSISLQLEPSLEELMEFNRKSGGEIA
jgi:CubicO group peptidase (beta-lactamase class C family)